MLNITAALLAIALLGAAVFAAVLRFRDEPRDEEHDAAPNAPA